MRKKTKKQITCDRAPAWQEIHEKYRQLTELLIRKEKTITTMESCTSGLIASMITDTEGSSAVLKGAFITYSNEAKQLQGVPAEILERYGVYSHETADAMAAACRKTYEADLAVGITGSFGNADPANGDSVPGEVYLTILTEDVQQSCFLKLPVVISRYEAKLICADVACELIMESVEE